MGLALFTVIGAEKGLSNGLGILGTAVMATLTGVGGGVIRDILVIEIPFILKEEIYAVLCLSGGLIYCRITSYNVCYTKLLRCRLHNLPDPRDQA